MCCLFLGGSCGEGVFVPLGTAVPWCFSPEEQGGPWAPPPCGDNSSETCWVFVWFIVRFSRFRCFLFLGGGGGVCLWGRKKCLVWCPSKPDPCLQWCLLSSLSLSLSLVVWCVRRWCFSLFSFSQALGKPKPLLWGLGLPLCFFFWPRATSSTRSSSSPPTSRSCPAPVFLNVVRLPGGGGSLSVLETETLGGVGVECCFCSLRARRIKHNCCSKWGWRNYHSSPIFVRWPAS